MAGPSSHPSGVSAPADGAETKPSGSSGIEDTKVDGDADRGEGMVVVEELIEAAPVFASGNAELERRLWRTFAALSLPKCGAEQPPASAAVGGGGDSSLGSDVKTREAHTASAAGGSSATAPPPKEGPGARRHQRAPAPAADATTANAAANQQTAAPDEAASKPQLAEAPVTTGLEQEACGPVISQQQRAVSPRTRATEEANPDAATATNAGNVVRPGSREPSVARPESPGAWSEATDSTGCTDSSDIVRPPAFGSWHHYSLADVPDEAMSARGMQRACHLILLQRRHASNSAAANDTNSSSTTRVASSASIAADEEAPDPRVRVGPRRRG